MPPTRLLIVEDHPIFGDALEGVLYGAMRGVHVDKVGTLDDAKHRIESEDGFDLVLLDLVLPDTTGFDGLLDLRTRFPMQPIAVISAFDDQNIVEKSGKCGAAGFIPKSSTAAVLVTAIGNMLRGDASFPDSQPRIQVPPGRNVAALKARLETLTQQQLRVLQMLCEGMLNKQIAHELEVGETTVKAHVGEILRKLGVSSRTQAVLEVSKLDLGAALALYNEDTRRSRPGGRH